MSPIVQLLAMTFGILLLLPVYLAIRMYYVRRDLNHCMAYLDELYERDQKARQS